VLVVPMNKPKERGSSYNWELGEILKIELLNIQ